MLPKVDNNNAVVFKDSENTYSLQSVESEKGSFNLGTSSSSSSHSPSVKLDYLWTTPFWFGFVCLCNCWSHLNSQGCQYTPPSFLVFLFSLFLRCFVLFIYLGFDPFYPPKKKKKSPEIPISFQSGWMKHYKSQLALKCGCLGATLLVVAYAYVAEPNSTRD